MVRVTDELLIEAVKHYPLLYDTNHQYFHDTVKRDSAWLEIADKFEKCSALDCKKRWTALRDCFRKSLKKRRILRDNGSMLNKQWKYERCMGFLVPFITERTPKTSSNVSSLEYVAENDSSGNSPTAADFEDPDYGTDIKYAYLEPSPHEYVPQNATELLASCSRANDEQNAIQRHEAEEKDLKRCLTEFTDTMHSYLETKRFKRDQTQRDPLASFFRAMEETVRTFRYPLQIEVKGKIASLVNEYEVKNFENNS